MLEFEELGLKLEGNKAALSELRGAIGYDYLKEQVAKLEAQAAADGFWDNVENSQAVLQKISQLKGKYEAYDALIALYDDAEVLITLGDEDGDLSVVPEAAALVDEFIEKLEAMRLTTLLIGEYDKNNAVITFHAGAGGTEAQDWNEMLVRMYTKWGERHGYKVVMIVFLDGDEA